MDGGGPRSGSCRVCVSQLVRFAGVTRHVTDFSAYNENLTTIFSPAGLWVKLCSESLNSGIGVGLKHVVRTACRSRA